MGLVRIGQLVSQVQDQATVITECHAFLTAKGVERQDYNENRSFKVDLSLLHRIQRATKKASA